MASKGRVLARLRSLAVVAAACLVVLPSRAQPAPTTSRATAAVPAAAPSKATAWVAQAHERVPRDPAPPRTGADATTASLAAARNDAESFQIVVRAGAAERIKDLTLGFGDLIGPGGATIPARAIRAYREHHVEVRRSATPGGAGPGLYPDILLPFRDPATGRPAAPGAPLKAQPVSVEPGEARAFWVDVVPPADRPGGTYKGVWWAKGDGGRIGGGTIELEVWRFALPQKPAFRSSVNQWNDHSLAADQVLVAHHLMPLWVDPAAARKLADGGPLNAAGLGFWSGAEDGSCRMGRPPDEAQVAQRAAAFPPGLMLYNLTARDVSGCPELAETIKAWGRALHAAGVANMVAMPPDPALADDGGGQGRPAVDIWVVGREAYRRDPERVRRAVAAGAEVWATTSLAADGDDPAWLIDRPPLGYRLLPGFVAQSLGLKGLLYWAADYWGRDPWGDHYRSADGRAWPGEGLLVYPGGPGGVAGVLPSVRLKHVRDGIEDFGLLALARAANLPGLAREIEAVAGRDWEDATADPAVLEAARRRIGRALDALR